MFGEDNILGYSLKFSLIQANIPLSNGRIFTSFTCLAAFRNI